MERPLSVKPSRFQLALLFALLPIFFLGDRVAHFTRGGTIRLSFSRDNRFVAIHHVNSDYDDFTSDDGGWFDRFRILDRETGRLVAIPKKTFLWSEGQHLKEIDGNWFLAISYSKSGNDRCWVQRIDKNTLAWEKPRWLPGQPVSWSNGKILCMSKGVWTIVDEVDASQEELQSASWAIISLNESRWSIQSDKFVSMAMNGQKIRDFEPWPSLGPGFVRGHVSDEEITLLRQKKSRDPSRPQEKRLVVEKFRMTTGERISSIELPRVGEIVGYSQRLINDGQTVLVFSDTGLHLFDIQSQRMVFVTRQFYFDKIVNLTYDPWIVLRRESGFVFLNTMTFQQSRAFPIPEPRVWNPLPIQHPINDTEYLVRNAIGEIELRDIRSDTLLRTYCEHRYELLLRVLLISSIIIWQVLWLLSNRRNRLFYPFIVAASLACIVFPLWMRVKYPGMEEEIGVLANGLMSGVITGMFSASWIGLCLERGNFTLRFLYFSACIFCASGVLLHQQESNTVLFHLVCVAMLLVMSLPLLLARWMNWRLPIEEIQESHSSLFQLSLASLLGLGTSFALILGAVRYDPYMSQVYLRFIDQSGVWRAIILHGSLLAIVTLAFVQFRLPRKRFYLRSAILVGSIALSLLMMVALSWEFTNLRMKDAVWEGYYLAWLGMHGVVCVLHLIPLQMKRTEASRFTVVPIDRS